MSERPKRYIEITINLGRGPHELNFSLDGMKITEAEVARLFDEGKDQAIRHFRTIQDSANPADLNAPRLDL